MKHIRLLITGPAEAAFNMAMDQSIAEGVRAGKAPPTLRFYGWERPSVSLGAFQSFEGINVGFLKENGIPAVRRPTGGRAILHGAELTYSISSRYEGALRGGLFDCYSVISGAIEAALRALGIPVEAGRRREKPAGKSAVCFQSVSFGEITAGGRKLVGSAQKRWTDGFLQQGSIPFEIDAALQAGVFTEFSGSAMCGLREAGRKDVTLEELSRFLGEAFRDALGLPLVEDEPSRQELLRAHEILPGFRCPLP